MLILLAGCDNRHEVTTQPQTNEVAANTTTPAAPAETVSAPQEQTPAPVATADETPAAAPAAEEPAPMAVAAAAEPAVEPKETEISPAILFQKCAACHGSHAEKSALNQSAIIGEWDSKRIADAIYGYQNGTFGGAMKTLMQNQVKDLTHKQVEALSEYIANLYVKTH